jgi:hypothetical protein
MTNTGDILTAVIVNISVFKDVVRLCLVQMSYSVKLKIQMYLYKENHLAGNKLKALQVPHVLGHALFLMSTDKVFKVLISRRIAVQGRPRQKS